MASKPDYLPVHRVGEWLGEQDVLDALQAALDEAIEIHGHAAKAVCWDIRFGFKSRIQDHSA